MPNVFTSKFLSEGNPKRENGLNDMSQLKQDLIVESKVLTLRKT